MITLFYLTSDQATVIRVSNTIMCVYISESRARAYTSMLININRKPHTRYSPARLELT